MFKLTRLRKELDFNREIGGIVNVLSGVASSEFYRLNKARKNLDELGDYLRDFFQIVDVGGFYHPLLEESNLPQALVLITSDLGFLGKLNISIVNAALDKYSGNERLIVVGKQGVRYIEETDMLYTAFPGISDAVQYQEVDKLAEHIIKSFLAEKFGRTSIIYPHFVSFAVWEVTSFQILPCKFLFPKITIGQSKEEEEDKVILEPGLREIVESLVGLWLKYVLYGIYWESKLAEWAARVMHLEGSLYEIKRLDKKYRFEYFRLLHEISDKNIREILASRLAMEQGSGVELEHAR
ncbi:MAG: F0F1 ATP synthase subunit gamma [Candidatus Omnitrophica bacterium]|nr:F0F1 ATP synthase subunit gamma [Candidatus Omnitrophota bacterium]